MRHVLTLTLLVLAAPLVAQEAPDLLVEDALILETSPVARAAGGYVTLTNEGDADYTLTRVESPFVAAELHETTQGADGVMRMAPREGFRIAPGETLELTRGGRHIMFMGLQSQLAAGDRVPVVLVFGDEARLPVDFEVVAAGELGEMDHGGEVGDAAMDGM